MIIMIIAVMILKAIVMRKKCINRMPHENMFEFKDKITANMVLKQASLKISVGTLFLSISIIFAANIENSIAIQRIIRALLG